MKAYPSKFQYMTSHFEGTHTSYDWQESGENDKIIGETAEFYKVIIISVNPKGEIFRIKKDKIKIEPEPERQECFEYWGQFYPIGENVKAMEDKNLMRHWATGEGRELSQTGGQRRFHKEVTQELMNRGFNPRLETASKSPTGFYALFTPNEVIPEEYK